MKAKQINKKAVLLMLLPIIFINIIVFRLLFNKNKSVFVKTPSEYEFLAPGREWKSSQKVENYFTENLHVSYDEAITLRKKQSYQNKIKLRLTENITFDSLVIDLEKYGFIRNKEAFLYALTNSKDTVPGRTDSIKIGNNTIDKYAYYEISEDMSAWEIAEQLLNHPNYFAYDDENKLFVP